MLATVASSLASATLSSALLAVFIDVLGFNTNGEEISSSPLIEVSTPSTELTTSGCSMAEDEMLPPVLPFFFFQNFFIVIIITRGGVRCL